MLSKKVSKKFPCFYGIVGTNDCPLIKKAFFYRVRIKMEVIFTCLKNRYQIQLEQGKTGLLKVSALFDH